MSWYSFRGFPSGINNNAATLASAVEPVAGTLVEGVGSVANVGTTDGAQASSKLNNDVVKPKEEQPNADDAKVKKMSDRMIGDPKYVKAMQRRAQRLWKSGTEAGKAEARLIQGAVSDHCKLRDQPGFIFGGTLEDKYNSRLRTNLQNADVNKPTIEQQQYALVALGYAKDLGDYKWFGVDGKDGPFTQMALEKCMKEKGFKSVAEMMEAAKKAIPPAPGTEQPVAQNEATSPPQNAGGEQTLVNGEVTLNTHTTENICRLPGAEKPTDLFDTKNPKACYPEKPIELATA